MGTGSTGPQMPTTIYFRLTPQVVRKRSISLAPCLLHASSEKTCTAREKKTQALVDCWTQLREMGGAEKNTRFDEVSLHRRALLMQIDESSQVSLFILHSFKPQLQTHKNKEAEELQHQKDAVMSFTMCDAWRNLFGR